jgi:guanyl-specific ribonuclease Sa
MMMIRRFLPAIVVALAAAVMDFTSGSTIANAITVGTSTTTNTNVPATTTTTTTSSSSSSSRNLFELPLPFDSVNNECKRTCDIISQEGEENENDNDNDFLINACPKVSSKEEE